MTAVQDDERGCKVDAADRPQIRWPVGVNVDAPQGQDLGFIRLGIDAADIVIPGRTVRAAGLFEHDELIRLYRRDERKTQT